MRVHKIQGQDLHGTCGPNDGVLFHREAGKTVHTAPGGRFHGVGAAEGTSGVHVDQTDAGRRRTGMGKARPG